MEADSAFGIPGDGIRGVGTTGDGIVGDGTIGDGIAGTDGDMVLHMLQVYTPVTI